MSLAMQGAEEVGIRIAEQKFEPSVDGLLNATHVPFQPEDAPYAREMDTIASSLLSAIEGGPLGVEVGRLAAALLHRGRMMDRSAWSKLLRESAQHVDSQS